MYLATKLPEVLATPVHRVQKGGTQNHKCYVMSMIYRMKMLLVLTLIAMKMPMAKYRVAFVTDIAELWTSSNANRNTDTENHSNSIMIIDFINRQFESPNPQKGYNPSARRDPSLTERIVPEDMAKYFVMFVADTSELPITANFYVDVYHNEEPEILWPGKYAPGGNLHNCTTQEFTLTTLGGLTNLIHSMRNSDTENHKCNEVIIHFLMKLSMVLMTLIHNMRNSDMEHQKRNVAAMHFLMKLPMVLTNLIHTMWNGDTENHKGNVVIMHFLMKMPMVLTTRIHSMRNGDTENHKGNVGIMHFMMKMPTDLTTPSQCSRGPRVLLPSVRRRMGVK